MKPAETAKKPLIAIVLASDPLTGVAHRRHFMAGFEARLASEEGG